jgi:hypothetical protein
MQRATFMSEPIVSASAKVIAVVNIPVECEHRTRPRCCRWHCAAETLLDRQLDRVSASQGRIQQCAKPIHSTWARTFFEASHIHQSNQRPMAQSVSGGASACWLRDSMTVTRLESDGCIVEVGVVVVVQASNRTIYRSVQLHLMHDARLDPNVTTCIAHACVLACTHTTYISPETSSTRM